MKPVISDSILYIGADDHDIDLFENQYPVPDGVSYNSYLILDEKVAVMDTVDRRRTETWFDALTKALNGREPDYLIISHMEPDHAYNIGLLAEKYPQMKLVGNAKTFAMLPRFFDASLTGRAVTVADSDSLPLGRHTLTFYAAPMVHWLDEARRYYLNIVGKYGVQVQALLKKAAGLDVKKILPLHGPVLEGDLSPYLEKYDLWSRYVPEEKGVALAYCSIHGNTEKAALLLRDFLAGAGEAVEVFDLCRCDMSAAVAAAFRYDRLVLACPTYDGGLFPPMEDFLSHLKSKNFQSRTAALVENGSWAPISAKLMGEKLSAMKDVTLLSAPVTVASAVKPETEAALKALAETLSHR